MADQTITANRDIDYILKDFNSSLDAMISFATVNFGPGTSANRLWTSFNVDSFSRNWLEIVALISDAFFFYFDNQATQTYLQTATVRSAVLDIAKQFGFVPSTATSASGNATFTVTGATTIPRGFRVRSSNGLPFFVTNNIIAVAAGQVTGTVLQGTIKTEQFTSKGIQNEEFELVGPNVIVDLTNLNPADITPQVIVSGNSYDLVNSFIRNNGTDSAAVKDSLGEVIGGGGRVFELSQRSNGRYFVRFGDGIFGRKLLNGELITVTYRTGGGSAGNIGEQTLVSLVDTNPFVSSVTNAAQFSGGADEQSITQLRDLIPASLRTLDRAVAETDYADLLEVTFTEVVAASAEKNTSDPGIDLNVYVIPTGSGITRITDNALLLNRLQSFLDRRKTVTVQFQILDAFGVAMLISLKVFVVDTASKTTVRNSIDTALTNFFNLLTGGINELGISFAEHILTEDLSDVIKNISGVDRFEFTKHTYRPRIQENVLGLITSYKSSPVEVFPNVSESEWLLGAAGPVTRTGGTVLFNNSASSGFTYNSSTGLITYTSPINVDLDNVSPGDQFRGRTTPIVDYTIFGVDSVNKTLFIQTGVTVDGTPGPNSGGSIREGSTTFESFKCFKKINATATNLSINSITDNELDLSVKKGTAAAISARILLDNSQIFVNNQFATGDFYLVDGVGNIWEIEENNSNTIKTSITAINDASISSVSSGDYLIVTKLVGYEIAFNSTIFPINFNSEKTIFSIGAQFANIGTIGDSFQISKTQTNIGNLGVAVDPIAYDNITKKVTLNGAPDLNGISSRFNLIDDEGQIFNLVAVDSRSLPSTFYDIVNQDSSFILTGSGLGIEYAQGFKVPTTTLYSVVSFHLKKSGNILGNISARIVNDDGFGFPNLASTVAISDPVNVSELNKLFDFASATAVPTSGLVNVVFTFASPPSLTTGTQYHLVILGDSSYISSQQDGAKSFDNSISLVSYIYNSLSGEITYSSSVNLSGVMPGHFFRDGVGVLYRILSVDDANDKITLSKDDGNNDDTAGTGLAVSTTPGGDSGSVYIKDNVYIAADISSPTYGDGAANRYNGSTWFAVPGSPDVDLVFSVEGPKTVTVDSNLTPSLGEGATISRRYYDDENEVSFIIGISGGSITSASDVNAFGKGTINSIPNSRLDNFVFRTSRFIEDVVNLRTNEIPQYSTSNTVIDIFGGVE